MGKLSAVAQCDTSTVDGGLRPGADGARHTLTYGQYRLNYEDYGCGDKVLVWLHSLLLDANLSRGLARTLAAEGYRVVLLDLLGHGRSEKPRNPDAHRMDLYAEQVLCLLDELGVDQVVLGGVSLGTNVSLLAATRCPEKVRGLILEMPVLETAAPVAALTFVPFIRLIRTRTFAELWVRPARLTGEIVHFLDRLWADNEPQDPEQHRRAA